MNDPLIVRTLRDIDPTFIAQAHRKALEYRPGPNSALGADEGGRTQPASRPPAGTFSDDKGEAMWQEWDKICREWCIKTAILIHVAKKVTQASPRSVPVACINKPNCHNDVPLSYTDINHRPVCHECDAWMRSRGARELPTAEDCARTREAARKRKARAM